ncbi:MAG: ABC transporter ATP-binding protein, partial [Lachnospiraceae bacterium]|nr:ABC transporter ATP-binding protein [Lachnospiraceae bacterium]
MAGESVISVRNLKTYFYTEKRCNKAVNGVSFEIRKGKCLCVVGESGCGKSVTASSIMQLLPRLSRIEEGEIVYHTKDKGDVVLSDLGKNSKEMRAYRGKNIAMIFQDPMTALNPVFKVGNQIAENIRQHEHCSKEEARKRTLE